MNFLVSHYVYPVNALQTNFSSKKYDIACVSLKTQKAKGFIPALSFVLQSLSRKDERWREEDTSVDPTVLMSIDGGLN